MVDAASAVRKHPMYGLVEWDVTEARSRIEQHKQRTGEPLSFSAFLVVSVAAAVAGEPTLHAQKTWNGRLVAFADVDVMVMVESELDGGRIPVAQVIRNAHAKSVEEVTAQIRVAKAHPAAGPSGDALSFWRTVGRWVPSPLRRLAVRLVDRAPRVAKQLKGTVAITSVGMFFEGSGWAVAPIHHPLNLMVGGMRSEDDRWLLSVTLGFDHEIVDGAPAARFAARLQEAVETAAVLDGRVGAESARQRR